MIHSLRNFFTPVQMKTLVVSILCLASVALADDFKTIDGKEDKNVKVKRVEPDGIVLSTNYGISKVYFTELPKKVQEVKSLETVEKTLAVPWAEPDK